MRLATMVKAPQDTLDYDVLFHKWLKIDDRLAQATSAITLGSTVLIDHVDLADTSLKFWLKGGQAGEEASVSFIATTLNGRTKKGCFTIRIRTCC